ncbi:MAG: hypothetical protein V1889_00490 [archaeon]
MVVKSSRIFLFCLVLVVGVLLSSGIVVAWIDCWQYGSMNGGTPSLCNSSGCLVTSFTGSVVGYGSVEIDPWCGSSMQYCCLEKQCWQWDETDETICETNDGTLNCTWNGFPMTNYLPNGSSYMMNGTCMMDWSSSGDFGGPASGCWNNDGNKQQCLSDYQTCEWKANDVNQNPWCWIKTLGDAQNKNSLATTTDIGCCDQKGCWSYEGNETLCVNGSFAGACTWVSKASDPWCQNSVGCCYTKSCSEAGDNQTLCDTLKMEMMMPCVFNQSDSGVCGEMEGGGFMFFNDSDSCFSVGGWYNSTGGCVMPSGGGSGMGGGGFMFGGEAHCWFADNQPLVCGNITGCAYCTGGNATAPNDVSNATDNICYGKVVGYCEGHDALDKGSYTNADNSANLACVDIQIKSACNYGPLPNCVWNSSVNLTGAFCAAGKNSVVKSAPPVGFCEHPDSKNNYTLCTQLIEEYMMPCKWDNSSAVVKNCTFNSGAVFGFGGDNDFGSVSSDTACTASGGTWQTEYYIDGAILKQDSWCEMTGFFNVDDGGQKANKANCDSSCWACEFRYNGSVWANVTEAEAACVGSALGYCSWINGSSAFNGLGWCDYPTEMEYSGSGDCNTKCQDCDFMNAPYAACVGSVANAGVGCQWVNDTATGVGAGYCVDKTKKVCNTDCFSCYDFASCIDNTTTLDCTWDQTFNLCKPNGFAGEVCFNGVDDDSDLLVDCSDPDCGFDNFCGGSSFGGGCFAQMTEGDCNSTLAFGSSNCTWINDTWNPTGWCDMPGSNCWKFNDDLVTCNATAGCTNESSSMGSNAWCEMNMTKMNDAACWSVSNESACAGLSGCAWKNNTWGGVSSGGWCDYAPMSACMELNSSSCGANLNCTWRADNFSMTGGWCDIACMNQNFNQTGCENETFGGLCQWKNMSATCQPSTFMMMGMGSGGKTGCWQYNGNETGCALSSVTCQYKNDSYSNNNLSATEPSGWCMDKAEFQHFGAMEGDVIQLVMDSGNSFGPSGPSAEAGVGGEVDIMGTGMRVSAEGFNFGAGIFNISGSIVCNGYNVMAMMQMNGTVSSGIVGTGNASGSFYWYLDTDGVNSGACDAIGDTNYSGYDFMISYVARNTTAGVVETKQLMRCSNGTWTATNALVTTSKKMSCGEIGGVMVAVALQDLESFSEYVKTANMRIYMASADASDSRTSPSDYVGPGYYTPGSIDFGFVDCSNPSTKDPKCKNIQKFGFNVFEECMNGVDDNEDGLADCADPICAFTPKCASGAAFSFVANNTDKVAPTVMFSKVDTLWDGAFMKVDTNEPSNMSVLFYLSDSTCKVLNITMEDVGSEVYQQYANFKPFHSIDLVSGSLGYALSNGTAYYYKIKTCDPSGNCGVSACANFTTKASIVPKSFIFKLDLPDGYTVDIPALNKTGYNFSETFTINGVPTAFDVGIKTNTSVTKSMNMTVHSNCGDGLSIGFYGINIYEPVKIDMGSAFICNATTDMMGMNSSLKKWNNLIDDMHLGGAGDYIQMNMPVAYSSANTFNFVDDTGANAKNVSAYVNCTGTTATACKIPVSLGF